jgi:hypothetical protein
VLSEFLQVLPRFQNPSNRIDVNIFIASQFCLASDFDKARDFLERGLQEMNLIANQNGFSVFEIVELKCKAARELAKLDQPSRSIDLLQTALQQVIKLEDPDSRDYPLIDIGEVYAEMRLYDQAIQIGALIYDEYRIINRLFQSIAFTAIVKNSDHDQIQNILLSIPDSRDRDNFLVEIAGIYSHNDQIQRAIELVSIISDPYCKALALVESVKKMDEEASKDLILDLLAQAQNNAYLEQDPGFRASVLSNIALRYLDIKQFSLAHTLLEQTKNLAMALSDEDIFTQVPRDFILQNIAFAFAKLKEVENTLETLNAMTNRVMSGSTLTQLAIDNSISSFDSNIIHQLDESEKALIEDDPHLADLNRVSIAESWSKIGMPERVRLISNQISDPILKELALGYADLNIGESDYDKRRRLSQACTNAGKRVDLEIGQSILRSVLEELLSFDEVYVTFYLKEIISNYFCLIKNTSEAAKNG